MARFEIDGYGQIELNNATWPRDGSIEAQSELDPTQFKDPKGNGTGSVFGENGMILELDGAARLYKLPAANSLNPLVVLYSTERAYTWNDAALNKFVHELDGFLPRAGYPEVGDKWTTNCFDMGVLDGTDQKTQFEAIEAACAAGPLYAVPGSGGAMVLTATASAAGMLLRVLRPFSMPDGTPAVQVQVVRK